MQVIDEIIATLGDGRVERVLVSAFWTAVLFTVEGERRCGLASTARGDDGHHHTGKADVRDAGSLTKLSARQLVELAASDSMMERSIGMAALNALLPRRPDQWRDLNAEEIIARRGAGKHVVMVGHFPFANRLIDRVGKLSILEERPRGGDLPAGAAPEVIPQADVIAITGTTLLNGTFDGLMQLRRPGAFVLLLGPTTPLAPLLFERGVDVLSGAVVEDVERVWQAAGEAANFQQLRHFGVRLVSMERLTPAAERGAGDKG